MIHPAAPRDSSRWGAAKFGPVAIAGLAISAVSAAMSTMQSIHQASYQRGVAKYQQKIADNNAASAEWQARDALQRGSVAEQNQRMKINQIIGTQRASLAASGVQVDTGSAGDITADTKQIGELDALTIRSNAEREAYGDRLRGYNAQAESEAYGSYANSISPTTSGLLAGVSGLAQVAGKWYDTFGTSNPFGSGGGTPIPSMGGEMNGYGTSY